MRPSYKLQWICGLLFCGILALCACKASHKDLPDAELATWHVQEDAEGKYGYVDATGASMLDFEYDSAWSFEQGVARVQQEGLTWLIDADGKRISTGFRKIDAFQGKPTTVAVLDSTSPGQRWYNCLIDLQGRRVAPLADFYDWVPEMGMYYGGQARRTRKLALFTPDGSQASEFYNDIRPIKYNRQWFVTMLDAPIGDRRYRLLAKDGSPRTTWYHSLEETPDCPYYIFSNRDRKAWESGYLGLIDTLGQEVIPPRYLTLGYFQEDGCIVGRRGNYVAWDVYNLHYKLVAEGRNGIDYSSKAGLLGLATSENEYAYFRMRGDSLEQVTRTYSDPDNSFFKLQWLTGFYGGLARVQVGRHYGYIDSTGREVVPLRYDEADMSPNGDPPVWKVRLGSKKYGFDAQGNEVKLNPEPTFPRPEN